MKRFLALLLSTVLCLGVLSGCGGKTNMGLGVVDDNADEKNALQVSGSYDAGGVKVIDYFGDETVLTELPERVAIVSGTPLNIWYDLGGKSVCTSNIADGNIKLVKEYADEMLALPVVGAVYALDMEAVVAQSPDLIITQAGVQTDATATLRDMGYPVISVLPRSFEEVVTLYQVFGTILDKKDLAQQKVDAMQSKIDSYVEKAPKDGKSVAMLYLTASSLSVKLDNSIAGQVAKRLHIRNIASNLPPDSIGSESTPLDIEYIVQQDPDMILVTSMIGSNELAVDTMEKHFADNQAWQTVTAVAEGKVYYLPQDYFLYNAGPYYDEGVRYMACTVYPEIYGEVSEWYGK